MNDNRPCGIQDAEYNAKLGDYHAAPVHILTCECNEKFEFHNTKEKSHLNIIANPEGDVIAVCSRKCKHLYENGMDPDYDELYLELEPRANQRHNDYILCWNYYVSSCKRSNEKVVVSFSDYKRMVPMSQVNEMIEVYKLR